MKKCGVYMIFCSANCKRYIGSSVSVMARWSRHVRELRRGVHANKKLQACWNKYGEQSFSHAVLCECAVDELLEIETLLIELAGSVSDGLNIAKDALAPMRGRRHSPETRGRIAAANTGVEFTEERKSNISKSRVGIQTSDAQKAAVSQANRLRQTSVETKAKISAAHTGRLKSQQEKDRISAAMKARLQDPQEREKMAAALRGRKLTEAHKAAISKGVSGQKKSPETIEKMKAAALLRDRSRYEKTATALRGVPKSEAHRAALSAAGKLRYQRAKAQSA